jgi:hypothetical protein
MMAITTKSSIRVKPDLFRVRDIFEFLVWIPLDLLMKPTDSHHPDATNRRFQRSPAGLKNVTRSTEGRSFSPIGRRREIGRFDTPIQAVDAKTAIANNGVAFRLHRSFLKATTDLHQTVFDTD